DVDVNDVGARLDNRAHLLAQPAEIGRQDGRGDLQLRVGDVLLLIIGFHHNSLLASGAADRGAAPLVTCNLVIGGNGRVVSLEIVGAEFAPVHVHIHGDPVHIGCEGDQDIVDAAAFDHDFAEIGGASLGDELEAQGAIR